MKRKYESELLQVIHEEMMDMHRSGFISDAEMRKFDKDCLVKEPEPAYGEIPVRKEHVSAAVG